MRTLFIDWQVVSYSMSEYKVAVTCTNVVICDWTHDQVVSIIKFIVKNGPCILKQFNNRKEQMKQKHILLLMTNTHVAAEDDVYQFTGQQNI